MIPENKHEAVARGLETAFGVQAYDSLEPLAANDGLSGALVYQMVVKGRPYLLRFVKETIAGIVPSREFDLMQRAAEAGIAPRVWYASVEDRVVVADFVETATYPANAAMGLAATLRTLHALPGLEPSTNALESLDGFVKRFAGMGLMPQPLLDELLRAYAQAMAVYPRNPEEWVPCHNDLKPQNILYDGDRFYLIDWEAAFQNDRYHDLAVVASFFATTEPEADAFLEAYFGEPADDYQRARFFVMTQLLHVSYVAIFAMLAARAGHTGTPDAPVPEFGEFQRRIVAGEVDLGRAETMQLYAHVHLRQALEEMQSPRFADAIALVGARHSTTHDSPKEVSL